MDMSFMPENYPPRGPTPSVIFLKNITDENTEQTRIVSKMIYFAASVTGVPVYTGYPWAPDEKTREDLIDNQPSAIGVFCVVEDKEPNLDKFWSIVKKLMDKNKKESSDKDER